MTHKNTVKTRRARENSAILEETQSQCTVGRRSLLLCVKTKEKFVTHDIVLFITFNLIRFEIKDKTEHGVIPTFLAFLCFM